MKRYKVFLSVLLSLAMLLGTFACAESAGGSLTLRNVALNLLDTEINIGPEASVSAALDEDALKLHVETRNGERTLTPMTAQINGDGSALFSIGTSGRVYSVSPEMLISLLDLDAEDLQALEIVGEFIDVFSALMNFQLTEENMDAYADMLDNLLGTMLSTEAEEVQTEIGDKSYTMASYKGDITMASAIASLDGMRTCAVPEFAAYAQLLLDMIALGEEESFDSFAAYADFLNSDDDMDMNAALLNAEYAFGGDENDAAFVMDLNMADTVSCHMEMTGGMNAQDMALSMSIVNDETTGAEMQMHADANVMTLNFEMAGNDGYGTDSSATFTWNAELSDGEISSFDGDMRIASAYSDQDEDPENAYSNSSTVALTLNGAKTEGLWKIDLDVDSASEYNYGADESYSSSTPIAISYAESAEADGSVTSAICISSNDAGMETSLQFELNVSDNAEIPALSADGAYALTEDTSSNTYTMLSADLMSLSADAMELVSDEGIAQLISLFNIADMDTDEAETSEVYDEYDETGEAEYEEYEDTSVELSSLEDAAAVFTGIMPDFTVPEGYSFYNGYANEDYIDVYFTDDAEHIFNYYVSDFGMDMGSEEPTFTLNDEETGYSYVECMEGSNYILFWFDENFDEAEIHRIFDGLKL